MNNPKPSPK